VKLVTVSNKKYLQKRRSITALCSGRYRFKDQLNFRFKQKNLPKRGGEVAAVSRHEKREREASPHVRASEKART
jgi:hypothetical protein